MDEWDYKVVEIDRRTHASDPEHLQRELKKLGREGWRLVIDRDDDLIFERPIPQPRRAVTARLTIKGADNMATLTITVDDTGALAALTFDDKVGEATSAPLSSDGTTPVVVSFTSDNPAVATVDAATGALTAVAAGTVNIGATVNDAITGAAALEPDGVTPFSPAPVAVQVDPGKAVSDQFSVTDPTGT